MIKYTPEAQLSIDFSERPDEKIESGCLYLVATPIGNLGDFSVRAAGILRGVSFIAAEDTRVTAKLLAYLGIKKELITYFAHNEKQSGGAIIERLLGGESCALVSDAGTPAISDPGEDLVRLCAAEGIRVCPIPGACAAISALITSGLSAGRFTFEGFLSTEKSVRRARLDEIADEKRTMIFYEAPHKLRKTLSDFYTTFGERKITICRELTKLHEEVVRTTLSDAASLYRDTEPRGEFVLVLEGAQPPKPKEPPTDEEIEKCLDKNLSGGATKRDAVKAVSDELQVAKNVVYKFLINK